MKKIKILALLLISLVLIKCDDNSSSNSGGSTLTPQYAYITDGTDLKILDVANPTNPTYVDDVSVNTSYFVSVSPDVAYVAQYDAAEPYLSLVNTSNSSLLTSTIAKSSANNFSLLSDMFTIQGTGFITDLYRGLNTIDTVSPTVTTSNTGSDTMSLTKLGNNLYIIDQLNGLSIYDVSIPSNPTYTGVRNNTDIDTFSYLDSPFGQYHSWVENDGTYIYVANIIDKKLKKFDATTLSLLGEVDIEGYATAFVIDVGRAYITMKASANAPLQSGSDSVRMYNLFTMALLDYEILNKASGVAVNGNYAYVTDSNALHIYDISSGGFVFESTTPSGYGNFIALGE